MTRARVKAIHAKVNSLLSMCDLDTPLNGLQLHSDTLCVLSYGGPDDPYEDGQGSTEDGQESSQDDEEEGEKLEKNLPGGGTTAGLSGTTAPGLASKIHSHASDIDSGTVRYRERGMNESPRQRQQLLPPRATAKSGLRMPFPVLAAASTAVPTGTGEVGSSEAYPHQRYHRLSQRWYRQYGHQLKQDSV